MFLDNLIYVTIINAIIMSGFNQVQGQDFFQIFFLPSNLSKLVSPLCFTLLQIRVFSHVQFA